MLTPTNSKINKGFTLTEFLISIALASLILTVVVSSQSTYTDGVALTNLADEISSMVFQAQAYSTGVKEFSPASSEFSASYGLTFSLLGSGSNKAYLSFADRNEVGEDSGNKIYNGDWSCPTGGASECLGKVDISRGNYIESLCATRKGGPGTVGPPEICSDVGRIDISFAYSSGEAQILFFNNGGEAFNPAYDINGAKIVLRSPGGQTRSVIIYATGQVSIQ